MADDLKRVGLKFTAEGAVDFKASLKDISAATKENYSELKLAQSQYDKNTSSTQKLTDKQSYLQKQTEAYTQKVQVLQKEVEEEKNKEDADTTAINKKTAELNAAQAKLNGYQSSLEDVNKALTTHASQIQDFGGKLTDVGGKIENVGSTMTKTITAPVAAAAGASVAAWKEVDEAMDTVTTKTGASGKALEDMQQRAKNLAETIPVSFQDAGTAIGEVNTRFGVTGQELEDLSGQFLKFAELNGTDVNSSIDTVQKTMAAFGVETKDAGAMLDTLNQVGQASGISMDTLAADMTKNATALQGMGMNAADAANLMGKLEKSGVDTGVAMTGMSKVQKAAMTDGISMQDEFKKALSSSDSAIDVFGSKAGPKLYAAFQQGAISASDFAGGTSNLNDALGSVSDTFESTEDPLDKMTVAMNKLKDLGAQLVDTAAPMIEQAISGLIGFIDKLKTGWEALSPGMQEAIEKAALIAAAVGPVVVAIGKLTTGVGGLATKFGDALKDAGSFGGALTSLAGGPVGIVVAAIAGIVTVLVTLWNTNEDFRNAVTTAWNAIKDVVGTVVSAIQTFWTTILQPVFQAIGEFLQSTLAPIFQTVWSAISTVVSTVFTAIAGFWTSILQPAFQAIGSFIQGTLMPIFQVVFMAIGEVVKTQFNLIVGVWQNILLPAFQAIGTFLKGTLGPVFTTIFNAIKTVVQTVFNAINGFWNTILKPAFTAIGNFLKGTLQPVFKTVFEAIRSVVQTVFGAIRGFWNSILKPVFTAIGTAASAMRKAVEGPLNGISRAFHTVFGGIQDFLRPVISWLKGIFNFHWSLPHIALPHFSISGSFSLNPPSVPHFGIDWYDEGGIFSSPTVIGVGEKRPEFVGALDDLRTIVREESGSSDEQVVSRLDRLTQVLEYYLPMLAKMKVILDKDTLVGELAPELNEELAFINGRRQAFK